MVMVLVGWKALMISKNLGSLGVVFGSHSGSGLAPQKLGLAVVV